MQRFFAPIPAVLNMAVIVLRVFTHAAIMPFAPFYRDHLPIYK